MALTYDPVGNRIGKTSTVTGLTTKYIIDTVGDLPVILVEMDDQPSGSLIKSYYYADAQPLAQWDHTDPDGDSQYDDIYFYLHDRLGSVRVVMDQAGAVMRTYTYDPFGDGLTETQAANAPTNAFLFTGQWYDTEIGQYCLRARMYDPALMRFTTRDPHSGYHTEPMTLHRYLYCLNDPVNLLDPDGRWAFMVGASGSANGTFGDLCKGFDSGHGINGTDGHNIITDKWYPWMPDGIIENIINLAMVMADFISGDVTGGIGFVLAKDESYKNPFQGLSIGWAAWGAVGVGAASSSGVSVTVDFAFSSKAQKVEHLQSAYGEIAVSGALPVPSGLAGNWAVGASYSRSLKKNEELNDYVDLWTVSPWGMGTTPGVGAHVNIGYMFADEIWNNR